MVSELPPVDTCLSCSSSLSLVSDQFYQSSPDHASIPEDTSSLSSCIIENMNMLEDIGLLQVLDVLNTHDSTNTSPSTRTSLQLIKPIYSLSPSIARCMNVSTATITSRQENLTPHSQPPTLDTTLPSCTKMESSPKANHTHFPQWISLTLARSLTYPHLELAQNPPHTPQ